MQHANPEPPWPALYPIAVTTILLHTTVSKGPSYYLAIAIAINCCLILTLWPKQAPQQLTTNPNLMNGYKYNSSHNQ